MTQPDPDMLDMSDLDALLADAGTQTSDPSPAFLSRMMQDALDHQPVPQARIVKEVWWKQALAALGGWQGMSGLAAATCAGFWIGISPPEAVPTSLQTLLYVDAGFDSTDGADTLLGYGWDIEEG